MKVKDIVLSDFLSRAPGDDSDLHEIIPVSLNNVRNSKREIL